MSEGSGLFSTHGRSKSNTLLKSSTPPSVHVSIASISYEPNHPGILWPAL